MAVAIQFDEGNYLGWRALWLRGPELALALVPDVGGRSVNFTDLGESLS